MLPATITIGVTWLCTLTVCPNTTIMRLSFIFMLVGPSILKDSRQSSSLLAILLEMRPQHSMKRHLQLECTPTTMLLLTLVFLSTSSGTLQLGGAASVELRPWTFMCTTTITIPWILLLP